MAKGAIDSGGDQRGGGGGGYGRRSRWLDSTTEGEGKQCQEGRCCCRGHQEGGRLLLVVVAAVNWGGVLDLGLD